MTERRTVLSFVIPAHNEEPNVGATVASVQRAGRALGVPFEVVVVDDASTDETAAVARAAGARVVPASVRQIARSRNAGAAAAEGEHLIFVDADTVVTDEVVRAAHAALLAGAVGGGSAVRFDDPIPRYGRLFLWLGMPASRLAKVAFGCFVYCRRDAFEAIGGFDTELFAGEEIEFSRALKRLRRGPFVCLREAVITSGRKLRTYSAWQLLTALFRLFVLGRRGVRRREGLELWYGPRKPDPGQSQQPS